MTQLFILTKSEIIKQFLFGITCVFFLVSCSNEKNIRNAVVSYNQEYWDIHYNPETTDVKPDNRVDYYWFEAGKIHKNQGGYSDYLLVSECKVYSENNKMLKKGQFKNGMKNGLWKQWTEDGTLIESANYNNGYRHGESLLFYENGIVKLRLNYKNGLLNGKTVEYYPDGSIKETRTYKNNILCGKRTYFDKEQEITKTETFKNGKLHGKQKIYRVDTILIHHYNKGELINQVNKNNSEIKNTDTTKNNGFFKRLFSKKKKTTQDKD